MMQIRSTRLLLRPYREEDFPYLFRLQSDPEIMRYIRPAETQEAAVRERIAPWLPYAEAQPGYCMYVIESLDNQSLMGYGIFRHRDFKPGNEVELGYAIGQEHWGQGYASEALRSLLAYARDTMQLPKVVAFTDPANVVSNRVLEKCGFRYVGRERTDLGEGMRWECTL